MYNLKLRRVLSGKAISLTIVSVYNLSYLGYNAQAPYCQLWSVRFYYIFQNYFINGMIFEKKILNIKCVFRFSLQLLSKTFLSLRRNERDVIKKYIGLPVKYPLFLSDVNEA
jgi:hypothetical protein